MHFYTRHIKFNLLWEQDVFVGGCYRNDSGCVFVDFFFFFFVTCNLLFTMRGFL